MAALTVLAIAVGAYHTCVLSSTYSVRCWGSNGEGQLGYGHTTDIKSPSAIGDVPLGEAVARMALGFSHTCVLFASGGNVKCWGGSNAGQLGYGNTNRVTSPTTVGYVPIGGVAIAIAAGEAHTCALLSGGGVKCWGWNSNGQLGIGNTTDLLQPAEYANINFTATAISCGLWSTCALSSALGSMKCWGYGYYGNLGFPAGVQELAPAATFLPIENIVSMALGDFHTCGLHSNGSVRCWGLNDHGQLGRGHTTDVYLADGVEWVPLEAAAASISAGRFHTCALLLTGVTRCWGSNGNGQLGYNDTSDVPDPSAVSPLSIWDNVTAIATGTAHTCVLLTSASVSCWGNNGHGQLGRTDAGDILTPSAAGSIILYMASPSATVSPTASVSHSFSSTVTDTHTCSSSAWPSPSMAASLSASTSYSPSVSWSQTTTTSATVTITASPSPSWSSSFSPSFSDTTSGSVSLTATATATVTVSVSWSANVSASFSSPLSVTMSGSPWITPSATATASISATVTSSAEASQSATWTASPTASMTNTFAASTSPSASAFPVRASCVEPVADGPWVRDACSLTTLPTAYGCSSDECTLASLLQNWARLNVTISHAVPSSTARVSNIAYNVSALHNMSAVLDGAILRPGSILVFSCSDAYSVLVAPSILGCDFDGQWKPLKLHSPSSTMAERVLTWSLSTTSAETQAASIDCARFNHSATQLPQPLCLSVAPNTTTLHANNVDPNSVSLTLPCIPSLDSSAVLSQRMGLLDAAVKEWASPIHDCKLSAVEIFAHVQHGILGHFGDELLPQKVLLATLPQAVLNRYMDTIKKTISLRLELLPAHVAMLTSVHQLYANYSMNASKVSIESFASNLSVQFSAALMPAQLPARGWEPFHQNVAPLFVSMGASPLCAVLDSLCASTLVRPVQIPTVRATILSAIAYGSERSIVDWLNGGRVPSQGTLSTLWERFVPPNATFLFGTSKDVVVSDGLPPALVLVQASGDIHDYSGLQCALSDNIIVVNSFSQVRVIALPAQLVSPAPASRSSPIFHGFMLAGERSLLTPGSSWHAQIGSLQCFPIFAKGSSVPYLPSVTVRVTVQPAIWAVPRAVHVQYGLGERSLGAPPPPCFTADDNNATTQRRPLSKACTERQLVEYAMANLASQPAWEPLALDLSGATNLTFILMLTNGDTSAFLTPDIAIHIGDAPCEIARSFHAGKMLFIECVSPAFDVGCDTATISGGCAPQQLSVRTGTSLDATLLQLEVIETSFHLVPTLLRCAPFCDLLGTSTTLRTSLQHSDISAATGSLYVIDDLSRYVNSSTQLAVSLAGQTLANVPPITYLKVCVGYTNPLSGVCMNESAPGHLYCAYGSGDDCQPCPRGALCPGGYRAVPRTGFWKSNIADVSTIECKAPTERCLGWNFITNRPTCADGYDADSVGCGWCADGFYEVSGRGTCSRCPSAEDPLTIVIPIVELLGGIVLVGVIFIGIVWAVAKLYGGSVQGGVRRTVEFVSALFQSVQLVSTVTASTAHALPDSVRPVVDVLNALQVRGILVDEACLKHQDPYIRVYALSAFALLLPAALVIAHYGRAKMPLVLVAMMSQYMALFLASYGMIAQTVMRTYQCEASTMMVRTALPLLQQESDGGAAVLAANDIYALPSMLKTCAANNYFPGCANVNWLLTQDIHVATTRAFGRTVICAGSLHAPALIVASLALVLALFAIPATLFWRWRALRTHARLTLPMRLPRKSATIRRPSVVGRRGIAMMPHLRSHGDEHDVRTKDALPDHDHAPSSSSIDVEEKDVEVKDPFILFLHKQRYAERKAYWWQLDCLILLTVAAIINLPGTPSSTALMWCQAAAVCTICLVAIAGKLATRPYKPVNSHLFITTIAVQAYSVFIQVLLAVSFSAESGDDVRVRDAFGAALRPLAIVCLCGAVLLLLTVVIAFAYSLAHGAVVEQQQQRLAILPRNGADPLLLTSVKGNGSTRIARRSDFSISQIDNPLFEASTGVRGKVAAAPTPSANYITSTNQSFQVGETREVIAFGKVQVPLRNSSRRNNSTVMLLPQRAKGSYAPAATDSPA